MISLAQEGSLMNGSFFDDNIIKNINFLLELKLINFNQGTNLSNEPTMDYMYQEHKEIIVVVLLLVSFSLMVFHWSLSDSKSPQGLSSAPITVCITVPLDYYYYYYYWLLLLLIIIIYSFRVFHVSVSWGVFIGVWVTASLLKSPGLLSGFWLFSIIL